MSGRVAREITSRILITGRLVLETPAHFGNGDTAGVTDMPLLCDPRDGVTPLLTGASIAGALRNYLREVERGYGVKGQAHDAAERLFGRLEKKTTLQSWLLVDDALGHALGIELRDGVALDSATHTAEDKKKYDVELLAAGTTFDIHLEFLESEASKGLLNALATALSGLAQGEIGLGQRKHRGLGRCRVTEWTVRRHNLTTADGLLAWLADDLTGEKRGDDVCTLLGVARSLTDRRRRFQIKAVFSLPGSLLIRSGGGEPGSPDMIHLRSARRGQKQPSAIVSGTSLAGAVRARTLRIANTILGEDKASYLVDSMFGHMHEEAVPGERQISAADRPKPQSSRVITEESLVEGGYDLVQSRVKIDRFTGGAFPGALFSEQPIFGSARTSLELKLELRNPEPAEIGLLLLVLKDLWTGDLPLGGESSVGRGRLAGQAATLTLHDESGETQWQIKQGDGALIFEPVDTPDHLNAYVTNGLWQYEPPAQSEGRPR